MAETYLRRVRHPRDAVAVGWPARLAQVGYALAPYPTEHPMGAGFRRALVPGRARAARARSPGRADGGWRARKDVPDAGTLSTMLGTGLAAADACAAILIGLAAARRLDAGG